MRALKVTLDRSFQKSDSIVGKTDLFSAPAALKLQKAFLVPLTATKREARNVVSLQTTDPLPHHKVVGPHMLKLRIRGSKFVYGLGTEL